MGGRDALIFHVFIERGWTWGADLCLHVPAPNGSSLVRSSCLWMLDGIAVLQGRLV